MLKFLLVFEMNVLHLMFLYGPICVIKLRGILHLINCGMLLCIALHWWCILTWFKIHCGSTFHHKVYNLELEFSKIIYTICPHVMTFNYKDYCYLPSKMDTIQISSFLITNHTLCQVKHFAKGSSVNAALNTLRQ